MKYSFRLYLKARISIGGQACVNFGLSLHGFTLVCSVYTFRSSFDKMCNFFSQISHLLCKLFHHDWQFMCKLFLDVLTCCVNFFCFWSHREQTFLKLCISCVNFVPTFPAHCTLVSKLGVNFISVSRRASGCACRGSPRLLTAWRGTAQHSLVSAGPAAASRGTLTAQLPARGDGGRHRPELWFCEQNQRIREGRLEERKRQCILQQDKHRSMQTCKLAAMLCIKTRSAIATEYFPLPPLQ